MSQTTVAHPTARIPLLATLTALVAIGWTIFGAHNWRGIGITTAAIVVFSVLAFGVVVPRARKAGTHASWSLGLGIPAVLLTMPVFWSGLPLVLGVAAVLLGNEGRLAERGSGKAIAGLVLGALAVVGYLAIYVGDGVIGGNVGFLFD